MTITMLLSFTMSLSPGIFVDQIEPPLYMAIFGNGAGALTYWPNSVILGVILITFQSVTRLPPYD